MLQKSNNIIFLSPCWFIALSLEITISWKLPRDKRVKEKNLIPFKYFIFLNIRISNPRKNGI